MLGEFLGRRELAFRRRIIAAASLCLTLRAQAVPAVTGQCLQASPSNPAITTSDCLGIYKAAVGASACDLCVCDANGSGAVTVADARRCLKVMTHEAIPVECPVCGGDTLSAASLTTTVETAVGSSTSSSLPYSSTTSTSTTVLPSPYSCAVVFQASTPQPALVGALQFDVNYSAAPGSFARSGSKVECVDLTNSLAAFFDNESTHVLGAGIINLFGFAIPAPVAKCTFDSSEPMLETADFSITVIDATTPNLEPVSGLSVSSSSSCISNGPFCGNGVLEGDEQCDGVVGPCPGLCGPDCRCSTGCTADGQCDDGDNCTANVCVQGECAFPPIACDDHNPCTVDSCDTASGACVSEPVEQLPCDDADPCTVDDHCVNSTCRGAAKQCSDGYFCNGEETCSPTDGQCVGGAPPACDDGNACTDDSCDELSDQCAYEDASARCDDANVCTDDSCDREVGCVHVYNPTNDSSCVAAAGRMTGGGRLYLDGEQKDGLTHAFQLMCDAAQRPNRLRVVWRNSGKRYRFRLEVVHRATCADNAAIGPEPPQAGFDTHEGEGTGTLAIRRERQRGASVSWRFTDAGEPNAREDITELIIRDAMGTPVLVTASKLFVGNHQAHAR